MASQFGSDLDKEVIAACQRARGDVAAAGDRLRRVHEAGVRLSEVQRRPGTRTLSSGLTGLQAVIRAAGISRQTANTWQRVGSVSVDSLEAYIADCEPKGWEITIAGLLALQDPKPERQPAYTIRFQELTDAARERFAYQLEVLGSTVFDTATPAETVVAVVERLYADVLQQRVRRPSSPRHQIASESRIAGVSQ